MIEMKDYDSFESEKNKKINKRLMALIRAMAPKALNPNLKLNDIDKDTFNSVLGAVELALLDACIHLCIPCRFLKDGGDITKDEDMIPCYQADIRCDYCPYDYRK